MSHPIVAFEGLNLNESTVFVDVVSIDSVSFASGSNLWLLNGLIVNDGIEYPFQTVYDQNPLRKDAKVMKVRAPSFLLQNEKVKASFVITSEGDKVVLSWEANDKFLLVRTVLISTR